MAGSDAPIQLVWRKGEKWSDYKSRRSALANIAGTRGDKRHSEGPSRTADTNLWLGEQASGQEACSARVSGTREQAGKNCMGSDGEEYGLPAAASRLSFVRKTGNGLTGSGERAP